MAHDDPIVWPGGEHTFRLGIGELRAIEQRSNAGCVVVMARLLSGQWWLDDVLNPLRLGLIGGGMEAGAAQRLVNSMYEERKASLYELAVPAAEVLRRHVMWDGDDQPGETQAGADQIIQTRSQTEKPDGQPITEPELS